MSNLVLEYYKYLISGNWSKRRPELPSAPISDMINSIKACDRRTPILVTTGTILCILHKEFITNKRKQTLSNKKSNSDGSSSPTSTNSKLNTTISINKDEDKIDASEEKKKADNVSTTGSKIGCGPPVSMEILDFIPEELKECNEDSVRAVVAAFAIQCKVNFKETVRKDIYYRDLISAVSEQYFAGPGFSNMLKNEIRERIVNYRTANPTYSLNDLKRITQFIRAFLQISDIMKDKQFAKLAYAMDPQIYCNQLSSSVIAHQFQEILPSESNPDQKKTLVLKSIVPYDPLINRYICLCVSLKDQNSERKSIVNNKFYVNKRDTILQLINELPAFPAAEPKVYTGIQSDDDSDNDEEQQISLDSTLNGGKFDPDIEYEVFTSKTKIYVNYSFAKFNGVPAAVIKYRDCIFDVIALDKTVLDSYTWKERLEMVPINDTRVLIETYTGKFLNANIAAFTDQPHVYYNYMHEGKSYVGYYTFTKQKRKNVLLSEENPKKCKPSVELTNMDKE